MIRHRTAFGYPVLPPKPVLQPDIETHGEDALAALMRADPAATGPRWPGRRTMSAKCAQALDALTGTMTAVALADALGITHRSAAARLSSLAELGLVERTEDQAGRGRKQIVRWVRIAKETSDE